MGTKERYRKRSFHVTLFDEEFEILEKKAQSFGMNKTEYIRDMIIRGEVSSDRKASLVSDEKYKALLYEINRIGNNVNQIAYNSNLKKSTGSEEIAKLRNSYFELFELLKRQLVNQESVSINGDDEKS